ncbi:MAG: REP-associated tyrosine transposase [Stenotrophomonas maltophilia]|uniref:REP-associated tyrosine transposase n=1 Tax=Stenotrophomonas maltophilia TaxID=40324 RepID=A0A7V8FFT1_STEMA|nr:MAG: REP-associated tyrosine transposase [Stenotrophomonas maltophilia]
MPVLLYPMGRHLRIGHAPHMVSQRLRYGRYVQAGNIYALTTVTAHRQRLFADAGNAALMIDALRHVEATGLTHSLAWVVMPDHLHWLLQLRAGTLAQCMGGLKSRSSRLINACLQRRGPLWQHGYHDHAIRTDESLRELAAYILANPVRAGLADQVGAYPHAWCRWLL